MKKSRLLTTLYATVFAFVYSTSGHAATYSITFYESIGDTSNIFTEYTVVGSGTFSIADSTLKCNG